MRRPEQWKKFSSNTNCDFDLIPIMLKHKLIQEVAIPKVCMKLYQNQAINESIGLLRTATFTLTLALESIMIQFQPYEIGKK